jgi:hypothetical protein
MASSSKMEEEARDPRFGATGVEALVFTKSSWRWSRGAGFEGISSRPFELQNAVRYWGIEEVKEVTGLKC